jgi:hypothetical protein
MSLIYFNLSGANDNVKKSTDIYYKIYMYFFFVISALEKKCPVCIGLFDEEDEVKQLPCSHRFHTNCIIPWLQRVYNNIHVKFN